jgi:localization factor PodJL
LGLSPIGPSGAGPVLAPKPGGKSAASEQQDNMPVGAINGPAASPQETAATLKMLATRGEAAAQYELGVRYSDGRGLPRDGKAAVQWLEKAAEQGLAPAQYRLGSYYEKGAGVDRDYAKARSYYQQAAENGNARAMHNLAVLCAEGNDGKADYAAASDWFRKAAEFGVRDSQYNLAILYARGLGVSQNMTQSYMWFAIAAAQGDQDAAKKRDEVGARLDSKDLAAAKSLVDGFKPRPLKSEANEVTPPRGGWESIKFQEINPVAKPNGGPAGKPKVSQL